MKNKKQQNQGRWKKPSIGNFSGQHFLRSRQVAKQIVEMGHLSASDLVLDLGAGSGRLTEQLAERAGKVWAVENDRKWARKLREKFANQSHVSVIERDVLQLVLPKTPFVVIASIPYAITTAILRKVLHPQGKLQHGVFVMEKGAAIRFSTHPILRPEILKWRMWFQFKRSRTLPSHLFSPAPKVDSAVLMVVRRSKPLLAPQLQNRFLALAKYGLKYPRAPIEQGFKGIFTAPQMTHLLRNLSLERSTEIRQLTEKQWAIIFDTMYQKVPTFRWPR